MLAVASGKGGVGKSTIAVALALAFSRMGFRVGLLDADLYGPDIPRMMGLTRTADAKSLTVWTRPGFGRRPRPIERYGLEVWSAQFLVGEGQALSFPAGLAGLLLARSFGAVDWGELDWLIVDLPPGTADIQQQLVTQLGLDGVLLVVTPEDVAHLDAKKVCDMFERGNVPVIGGVENMASLACPCCGTTIDLFAATPEERTVWALGVPRLARVPWSPEIRQSSASGSPIVAERSDGAGAMFAQLADAVLLAFSEC